MSNTDDQARPPFAVFDVRTCRDCGCSDDDACMPTCWWVEQDLCSACESKAPTVWHGMPDPHRHNPLGVAVILAGFMLAWVVIGVLVVLTIAGVLP